ncbi:MAG TPA: FAD-dependent oxidoreductase, partial [Candidatus Omnitrophota bacterium]|nr:FAD-dependent oxidoreductase [Candidatus Omnitrophota bacterium]
SLKRQRLTMEDKEMIPFDCCLIDEYGWLPPEDMKGTSRNGFWLINRLDHIKAAIKQLLQVDTVLVQSDSWNGLRTVAALAAWNKEVIWVCSQDRVLASLVDPEISARIAAMLEKKGIRVLTENAITEVLGESDAKAARLKSGKILAAQMILAESYSPDYRLLKDTELFVDGVLSPAGEHGATSCPNVFIAGRGEGLAAALAASYNSYDDYLGEQGTAVASQMLKKNTSPKPMVSQAEINGPGFQLISVGHTGPWSGPADEVYLRSDEATDSYQKFYIREGVLAGAVLINAALSRYQALALINSNKALSEEYLQNHGFERQPQFVQAADRISLDDAGCLESGQPCENAQNS